MQCSLFGSPRVEITASTRRRVETRIAQDFEHYREAIAWDVADRFQRVECPPRYRLGRQTNTGMSRVVQVW